MIDRRTFLASLPAATACTAWGESRTYQFPADFLWGAATSAPQVESAPERDGGGETFWAPFLSAHPRVVRDGSSPEVTCAEERYWPDDVKRMSDLGLNSYRFSISWPRVLPDGRRRTNAKGLDYYDRLIDNLLARKIKPLVTVFHFDYPQALEAKGGWMSPDSPRWFADYADLLSRRYADRVEEWHTINEPNIFWSLGNEAGVMPPGVKRDTADLLRGAHHLLLAHGLGVQALRAAARRPLSVSIPLAGTAVHLPITESQADVAAAREMSSTTSKIPLIPGVPPLGLVNSAFWTDPIYLGRYSESAFKLYPALHSIIGPSDMSIIATPMDRCAVNLYTSPSVRAGNDGKPETVPPAPNAPRSHYGWEITPSLLYWAPKFLYERYRKPVIITENGISLADKPDSSGRVHDPQRIAFLKSYLDSLRRACAEGVPVQGYMHWSLLDNWEFTSGFGEQFGLIYVDHKTQKRIVKDSALFYREVIRSRGAALG